MKETEIRENVVRILGEIAPEADLAALDPDANIRDQLDIDSMDLLNFVVAIDHELRIPIPETDYRKLATLNGCVEYLAARLATATT
ncbi:MAG TPA: acyl carrier protein [Chloroflexota bacterium]|nr:acyl carrier protein [Chloroflexota bacterium]